jgi:hypothetical protein
VTSQGGQSRNRFAGGNINLYEYMVTDLGNLIDASGLFLWDAVDAVSFAQSFKEYKDNPGLGMELIFS